METRANYLLIGAVTLFGFIGLLGFLMWFAKVEVNRQFDYYDVLFPAVSGLSRASEVRFSGLSVWQVLDMQLMDENGLVRVRLEVTKGTPVREGARASLETQGVTSVAVVAIRGGTPMHPCCATLPPFQKFPPHPQPCRHCRIGARLNTVAEQLSQYLPDAQWGDSVPVMVQTLMVRKLAAYPVFSHVGRAPIGTAGDYALLSEIGDFSAVVEGGGAVITLRISAQIVEEASARIIARQEFSAQQPVTSTATPALIKGFDLAGQQLFDQLGNWASSVLRGNCQPVG